MPRAKSKRPSRVDAATAGSRAAQSESAEPLPPPRKRVGKRRKSSASSLVPSQKLTVFESLQDLVSAAGLRDGMLLGKFRLAARVCAFLQAGSRSCKEIFECACTLESDQTDDGVRTFTFIITGSNARRLSLDAGETFLHIDPRQLKSVVGDSLTSLPICDDVLRLCDAGYLHLAVVSTSWELVVEATPHIFHYFDARISADGLVPPIRRHSSEQLARVLRTIQPAREDIQLHKSVTRQHRAVPLPALHSDEDISSNQNSSDQCIPLKASLVDQLLRALTPAYICHQHQASVATSSGEVQTWGAKLLNDLPDFFLPRLRPYQLRGLDWMVKRECYPSPVGLQLFGSSSTWVRWNAISAGSGDSLAYNLFNGALCVVRDQDSDSGGTTSNHAVNHTSKIPISTLPTPSVIPGCGGILADEMGLGKTVIFIALMTLDRKKKKKLVSFDVRTPKENVGPKNDTDSADVVTLQPNTSDVVNGLPVEHYASMPIAEIAQLLRDRKLQTTGGKDVMMRRLIAADSEGASSSSRGNYVCLCGKRNAPECAWVACRRCHQQVHSVCIGLSTSPHAAVESSSNLAVDEHHSNPAAELATQVSDQRTPLCFTCRSVIFEAVRLPQPQREAAPMRSKKRLSFSTVVSDSLVPSTATLIVCPDALIAQWMSEIRRHTAQNTFRVVVYEGIKAIAKTGRARPLGGNASKWPQKAKLLDPRFLATCADVVLVSYTVLQSDFHFKVGKRNSDATRRAVTVASPLRQVFWHRLALDEAQMVDRPTAMSAEFCSEMSAHFRWCITGTPVHRGLEDLYGLLVFLRVAPFSQRSWWKFSIENPLITSRNKARNIQHCDVARPQSSSLSSSTSLTLSQAESFSCLLSPALYQSAAAFNRLIDLLRPIFWRHSKELVQHQLRLPSVRAIVHTLDFSPVERLWYTGQRDACRGDFQRLVGRLRDEVCSKYGAATIGTQSASIVDLSGGGGNPSQRTNTCSNGEDESHGWMNNLSKTQWRRVLTTLGRLRQACCHPQVGSHGIHRLDHNSSPLSMSVIVDRLIARSRIENSEAQRILLMARNGSAAVAFLRGDMVRAAEIYRGSLNLAAKNKKNLSGEDGVAVVSTGAGDVAQVAGTRSLAPTLEPQSDTGIDALQEIHILHNLIAAETARLTSSSGFTASEESPGSLKMLHLQMLKTRLRKLENSYVVLRRLAVENTATKVDTADKAVAGTLDDAGEYLNHALRTLDVLQSINSTSTQDQGVTQWSAGKHGIFRQLVDRCHSFLAHYPLGVVGSDRLFRSPADLQVALKQQFSKLLGARNETRTLLLKASSGSDPSPADVASKGNCGTCASHLGGNGPPCSHCRMLEQLKMYNRCLYCYESEHSVDSAVTANRNAANPTTYVRRPAPVFGIVKIVNEISCVYSTALSPSGRQDQVSSIENEETSAEGTELSATTATKWEKLFPALRKEETMFKECWESIGERLSGLDELKVAKSRIRMAAPGEVVAAEQLVSVVQSQAELDVRDIEFQNLEASAQIDLDNTTRRLRYLSTLRVNTKKRRDTETKAPNEQLTTAKSVDKEKSVEECPLCLEEISSKRTAFVLHCGHIVCSECVEKLRSVIYGAHAGSVSSISSSTTEQAAAVGSGPIGGGTRRRDSGTVATAAPASPTKKKNRNRTACIKCPWCRTIQSTDQIHEVADNHQKQIFSHSKQGCAPEQSAGATAVETTAGVDSDNLVQRYGTKIAALVREIKHACHHQMFANTHQFASSAQPVDASPGGVFKCLVFSTWEEVLSLAEIALKDSGVSVLRLGARSGRDNVLQQFKTDPLVNVLLLPLKHGANGLNLVEANHVFFVEPLLDSGEELQAIGRVHRFGQTRRATVHYFAIRETIEEPILYQMKPYLKYGSKTNPTAPSGRPLPPTTPVQDVQTQGCAHTRQGLIIASQHKSPREKLCLADIVSILERSSEK